MLANTPLQSENKVGLVCTGSICLQPNHPQITVDFLRKNYQLNAIFKNDTSEPLPPAERAAIFLEYLFNPEIKLIAAIRGGEGTADILPFVHEYSEKIKSLAPKFILGFSDITALLIYFAKHYQWPVVHGSSPLQFALGKVNKKSEQLTMNLLFGKTQNQGLTELKPLNNAARTPQLIDAELTGGCLSLIDISIKDIWEIETTNKILFFEDVSEKAHKIIRALKYFSRIGLFQSVKAVIFGDFNCAPIGCNEEEQESNHQAILKVLDSFARHHQFPVLQTNDFGHGKINLPLVYSSLYRLQLGDQAHLTKI
jgi:muramoyltetrapeptide carboxypeptidase